MKKILLLLILVVLLTGCAGEQIGDTITTETETCKTTMEYKWVWSFFEGGSFKLVPTTKCEVNNTDTKVGN